MQKLSSIRKVDIKIRFPDQSVVSTTINQSDTGATLYTLVRDCLAEGWRDEHFVLREPGLQGGRSIPDSDEKLLIKQLGLERRVLLVFHWHDAASTEARAARQVLKEELRAHATEMDIVEPTGPEEDADDDPGTKVNLAGGREDGALKEEEGKKKGMPKWLKGLTKK